VIETERILELPLPARQVTDLITLSGAAAEVPSGPVGSMVTGVNISIAGGADFGVQHRLDGALHNNRFFESNLPMPFPDALAEFRVSTSVQEASTGRSSGGAVSSVTKSGTNQPHGTLFWFVRNAVFNARAADAPVKGQLKRNQPGFSVGGPVVQNRLFFFTGYQSTIVRSQPRSRVAIVPTPAMLRGDWNAFNQCYNPNWRDADFRDGFVDPTRYSSAARLLAARLPQTTDPCGQLRYGLREEQHDKQTVNRIDYQHSPSHNFFGRYMATFIKLPPASDPENVVTRRRDGQRHGRFSAGARQQHPAVEPSILSLHQPYVSLYAQDTWAATPRVTLNYGVRWEPFFPMVWDEMPGELGGVRVYRFSAAAFKTGQKSAVFPHAPAGFTYPQQGGSGPADFEGRSGLAPQYKQFAPRLGVAWDPRGRGQTSIRVGYGFAYDVVGMRLLLNSNNVSPWAADIIHRNGTLDDPWQGLAGGNPFPFDFRVTPQFASGSVFLPFPQKLEGMNVQSWNVDFQQELKGVNLNGNYTLSHCESDRVNVAITNPNQTAHNVDTKDRARCSSDRRHIVNLTAVATTPRLGGHPALTALGSEWTVAVTFRARSGEPLSITTTDRSLTGLLGQVVNKVSDDVILDTSGKLNSQYLNPAAFALPALGTFGNSGFFSVPGIGTWDLDLAVTRAFRISRESRLELRAEVFNPTNAIRAVNPVTNFNAGNFGRIINVREPRIILSRERRNRDEEP
jgi:hypothetical protein